MSCAEIRRFSDLLEDAGRKERTPLGYAPADHSLQGGLCLGALHEVFAAHSGEEAAASGFALALARRALRPHAWLLWVRQDFSAREAGEIHAAGLLELNIDPARVVMVCTSDAKATLRAGAEGLACKGVGAVLLEPWGEARTFNLTASRRLTLAARQHGVTAIALRFGANPTPSAAETRWLVRAAPSLPSEEDWGKPRFDAALVRNRHGTGGQWVMEWDCDNGIFQAHSGALAATSSDRPVEAAMERMRKAG